MLERLQKIIARAGLASRRHAEVLMTSGMVTVNGQVVTELGSKADVMRDHIKVSGRLIRPDMAGPDRERVYLALHKPAEVVSTLADPEGRRSLRELLHGISERLFPIGRLEYHASGLLLLTNDGDLANRLLQSHRIPQTWHVKLASLLSFEEIEKLSAATGARIARLPGQNNPWYEITLPESSSDTLRTKLFHAGHPVDKMKRVAIASVLLDRLPPGAHRPLAPGEIAALNRAAAGESPREPAAASAPAPGGAPLRPKFAPAQNIGKPPRPRPERTERPEPIAADDNFGNVEGAHLKTRQPLENPKSQRGPRDHSNFSRPREFAAHDRPRQRPEKPGRPAWSRPPDSRPQKSESENPERPNFSRPQGSKPQGDRPWKSRPGKPAYGKPGYGKSSRPSGSRPEKFENENRQPSNFSPPQGSKPQGSKPQGGRPWKPRPGKPQFGKSSRPPGAPWKAGQGTPPRGDSPRPTSSRQNFSRPPESGSRPQGQPPWKSRSGKPAHGKPFRPQGSQGPGATPRNFSSSKPGRSGKPARRGGKPPFRGKPKP